MIKRLLYRRCQVDFPFSKCVVNVWRFYFQPYTTKIVTTDFPARPYNFQIMDKQRSLKTRKACFAIVVLAFFTQHLLQLSRTQQPEPNVMDPEDLLNLTVIVRLEP